jgi:hypothetical protein
MVSMPARSSNWLSSSPAGPPPTITTWVLLDDLLILTAPISQIGSYCQIKLLRVASLEQLHWHPGDADNVLFDTPDAGNPCKSAVVTGPSQPDPGQAVNKADMLESAFAQENSRNINARNIDHQE